MLDDLVTVIETLQRRIRDYGPSLREHETRTRTALIDPLLRILGWEVSDPAAVTAEYPVGRDRVDYALLSDEGRPMAFVEAKSLHTALEQDRNIDQLVRYAFTDGLPYAVLTDGNDWHVYDLVSPTMAFKDRRILDVSLTQDPTHEIALGLLLIWRPNLASGKVTPAQEPLFLTNPPPISHPPITQQSSASFPDAPTDAVGWHALSTVLPKAGDPHPIAIRFDSNDVAHAVTSWRQVVQHTVGWLYRQARLKENDVPVASSTQRYIVNTIAYHQNNRPFHTEVQIPGTPFVYEGNVSSRAALSNAKKLLQHCGIDPATVQLQVGQ